MLNMGGGFGIHYRKQEALPADAFAEVIVPAHPEGGLPAGAGTGPLHRRQRRASGQPGDLYEGFRRQAFRHPGRGDERPDSSDAVRFVPSHLAGAPATDSGAAGGLQIENPGTTKATWSVRCASRAISWPRTAACRR